MLKGRQDEIKETKWKKYDYGRKICQFYLHYLGMILTSEIHQFVSH